MSFLGDAFDSFVLGINSFITSQGGIFDFIINAILGLKDFIVSLFAIAGTLLTILYYIFGMLEFFISIILNPYLLGMLILGTGFYYGAFASTTKKDMLMTTGVYYKYVFESIFKITNSIYTIVHKIVTGIIDII